MSKTTEKIIFTPCLLYTSALLSGFIFSMLFLRTTEKPVYIIDNVIFSLNDLDKKIEKNTMAGVKKYGSSDITPQKEVEQIKNEIMLIRERVTDIKLKIKNKPWAN